MPLPSRPEDAAARLARPADDIGAAGPGRSIVERAVALHNLQRLRMRQFVSPVMADPAMSLMLTLLISECEEMVAGEESVLLANHIAPVEGAALVDTLVQAGLAVATGKMPGRRSVGLTPLGSARMRAYVIDSSDLI